TARRGHAVAYDNTRGMTVLFGGYNPGSPGVYLNDTWEWDGSNWATRNATASPSARESHAMVYDEARGAVVLFGGESFSGAVLGDTWEWNGTGWTQEAPPNVPPP